MDEESYTTPTSRGPFFYSSNPSPPLHLAPMNNNSSSHPTTWRNNNSLLEMNYLFHHPKPKSEATASSSHSYQLTRQLEEEEHETSVMKSKIISHPQYSNLLEVYMDCQKVGASAEIVNRLTAVRREYEAHQKATMATTIVQRDPELDQFMEAYYNMVVKFREELTRPWQEAMEFIKRTEAQLKNLSNDPIMIFSDKKYDVVGSSDDEHGDDCRKETELPQIDPRAEDRELKTHLLKKYSGYLSNLKQELSKKKKKGKLPKEARQKLLNWWELHYKWPYPSETEKVALAESTGLDQKQINNWFINQRKRHWKPSEDMQFVVMEGLHPQNTGLYMEGHYMADAGHYRLGP